MKLNEAEISRVMTNLENNRYLAAMMQRKAFEAILYQSGYGNPQDAYDEFTARHSGFRESTAPIVGEAVADALNSEIESFSNNDDDRRGVAGALWDTLLCLFDLQTEHNQRLIGEYIVSRVDDDELHDFLLDL